MNPFVQTIAATVIGVLSSAGFWAYLQKRDGDKKANHQLMMGLAYEKIMSLGMMYIERGWITDDEYEDFRRYLYDPYKALGGNGVTERIMAEVSNLPIRSRAAYARLLQIAKERGKNVVDRYESELDDAA